MYKKNLLLLLAAGAFLFFQVHIYLPYGKTGIRPDLLFCFVLYLGVTFPLCRGALACCFTGYCLEILSGANGGLYILLYLCSFLCIKGLKFFFSFDTLPEMFLLFGVCSVVKGMLLSFSFAFVYEYSNAFSLLKYCRETVFTAALFPLVFVGLCRLYREPRAVADPYTTLSNGLRVR